MPLSRSAITQLSSSLAKTWGQRWQREIERLINTTPPPLILPDAKLMVVFSPKSACTSVVIWFLHQSGLLPRAREYSRWPHDYRVQVYYQTPFYQESIKRDLRDFKLIRVVRDPFDRAASGFIHAQWHSLLDKECATYLGRPDVAEKGLSFKEFLDVLEHLDLTSCDEHFRIQRHPIEDRLPVSHLINISKDDLFVRLNGVEADFGLPITNFGELDWIHTINRSRNRAKKIPDITDAYNLALSATQARRGPRPPYGALLTPVARERIARLYAIDLASYGY